MRAKSETTADVERWWQHQTAGLWPAALGSLCLRRVPCVRNHCRACLSGEKHPSYVLYTRRQRRRAALYVPQELVPEVRRCLENGRALQKLLYQAAPRYLQAWKQERTRRLKKGEHEPRA